MSIKTNGEGCPSTILFNFAHSFHLILDQSSGSSAHDAKNSFIPECVISLICSGTPSKYLSSCIELNTSGSSATRQRKNTRKSISGPIWWHQLMLFGRKYGGTWVLPTMLMYGPHAVLGPVCFGAPFKPSRYPPRPHAFSAAALPADNTQNMCTFGPNNY